MHFQSQNLPFQFVDRQARIMSTLTPLSDPRDDTHISLAQTKSGLWVMNPPTFIRGDLMTNSTEEQPVYIDRRLNLIQMNYKKETGCQETSNCHSSYPNAC